MNVQVKRLLPADAKMFNELLEVFQNTFDTEGPTDTEKTYAEHLLQNSSFFAFAAMIGNDVVGGATGYLLDQYNPARRLAYIYDVAVLAAFQRKGIGRALMHSIRSWCFSKGCNELLVQAEADDDDAIAFYRSLSETSDEVNAIHFVFPLR
jgi:aminoglycoside 3-N-acetyltransferase I